MRMIWLSAAVLLASFSFGAAAAEPGRYQMQSTADGYVRLDTQTGAMSLCRQEQADLVCRPATDERIVPDEEVERLQAELDGLRIRVAELEKSRSAKQNALPTEEEFDRTMGYMERFFRRFMDIVRDFEKNDPKPAEPPAGRT